jgi:hypothetical protein
VNYSILTYVLLLGSVAPLLLAAWMFGTIDWTPWLILLVVGVALAFAGRRVFAALALRLHRASAAAVAGEVAPEHAPGGWFVWAAVPLWTIALGLFLNVQLDSSPAQEHPSRVVQITGGKGPRVHLQDFRGAGTISMHRNNPLVNRVSEGQAVTIVARRGFFGWAWIEAIR